MELQTLTDLFCDHARYFLGYSPATLTRYRNAIRLLQKSQDLRTIAECTPDAVRAFFYRVIGDNYFFRPVTTISPGL